jgi:cell filamentation protein
MNYEAYDSFDDPYCYKGSLVLKNKAKLHDQSLLKDFELEMTTLRSAEALPHGRLDPKHYRSVHRHLFQDVYSWAGKYRTVRTSKGGNPFCFPENIGAQTDKLFLRLRSSPFTGGAKRREFVAAATEFLADLNVIHCFRDGNGRAQLSFMYLLSLHAGHPLELSRVRPETFLPAMVSSFAGDLAALKRELEKLCK